MGVAHTCSARNVLFRMTPSADGSNSVRLSTDDLPSRNRDEIIREFYGRIMLGFEITPHGDVPLSINATAKLLPGITLAKAWGSPRESARTSAMLMDGIDDVLITTNAAGFSIVRPDAETVEVAPGEVAIATLDVRASFNTPGGTSLFSLLVPRQSLATLVPQLNDRPIGIASGHLPALKLLFDYARLIDQSDISPSMLRQTVATNLLDLAAVALGATREATEIAKGRGMRAARLAAVKNDIAANLTAPSLSAETVAARLRISPRYVRKLFESEGLSFSEYVTAERLALVHRRLVNPQESARIATLAFDAGFNEVATFNRLFRRRYGMTPSDVRDGRR